MRLEVKWKKLVSPFKDYYVHSNAINIGILLPSYFLMLSKVRTFLRQKENKVFFDRHCGSFSCT